MVQSGKERKIEEASEEKGKEKGKTPFASDHSSAHPKTTNVQIGVPRHDLTEAHHR